MQLLSGDARRAVFSPLDDGALRSEAVVRRVGSAIALGLLGDGEQLPSETDLAPMLNVSTVTLRDALAELRKLGLVETRRGRGGGSFVRSRDDALAQLADARLAELGTTGPARARRRARRRGGGRCPAGGAAGVAARDRPAARHRRPPGPRRVGHRPAPDRRPVLRRGRRLRPVGAADDAGDGSARGAGPAAVAPGVEPGLLREMVAEPSRRHRRDRGARRRPRPGADRASTSTPAPCGRSSCACAAARPPPTWRPGPPQEAARWTGSRVAGVVAAVTDVVERVFTTVADVHAAAARRLLPGLSEGPAAGLDGRRGRPARPAGPARRRPRPDRRARGRRTTSAAPVLVAGRPRTAGGCGSSIPTCARPASGFYDYTATDWFDVPRRTGLRHVVGPYVDVHGTGRYLLTLTGPVLAAGEFLGVVGADVPVSRFETHLLEVLGAVDGAVLPAQRRGPGGPLDLAAVAGRCAAALAGRTSPAPASPARRHPVAALPGRPHGPAAERLSRTVPGAIVGALDPIDLWVYRFRPVACDRRHTGGHPRPASALADRRRSPVTSPTPAPSPPTTNSWPPWATPASSNAAWACGPTWPWASPTSRRWSASTPSWPSASRSAGPRRSGGSSSSAAASSWSRWSSARSSRSTRWPAGSIRGRGGSGTAGTPGSSPGSTSGPSSSRSPRSPSSVAGSSPPCSASRPHPASCWLTAVGLLVVAFLINVVGTRALARVAKIGLAAELIGVVVLGLYLLLFQREQPFSVFFDSMGAGGDQAYFVTFLAAALSGPLPLLRLRGVRRRGRGGVRPDPPDPEGDDPDHRRRRGVGPAVLRRVRARRP